MEILGAGEGRQPRSGATRRDATRRAFIAAGILALFAFTASGPIQHLWSLAGAGDWGSDWLWLADGLNRLLAGLPLNHPEYVAGPFSQLADGPTYTWSLHPPYNATLVAPALLLLPDLRQIAWTWLIAAALAGAVWLAWPRGLCAPGQVCSCQVGCGSWRGRTSPARGRAHCDAPPSSS